MRMLEELTLAIESGRNVISLQCQLPERLRIIEALQDEIVSGLSMPCHLWGLGKNNFLGSPLATPLEILAAMTQYPSEGFFILEDLHPFLHDSGVDMQSKIGVQQLRSQLIELASTWEDSRKYTILLGTQNLNCQRFWEVSFQNFGIPYPPMKRMLLSWKSFCPSWA
jgi:hypothetical protein